MKTYTLDEVNLVKGLIKKYFLVKETGLNEKVFETHVKFDLTVSETQFFDTNRDLVEKINEFTSEHLGVKFGTCNSNYFIECNREKALFVECAEGYFKNVMNKKKLVTTEELESEYNYFIKKHNNFFLENMTLKETIPTKDFLTYVIGVNLFNIKDILERVMSEEFNIYNKVLLKRMKITEITQEVYFELKKREQSLKEQGIFLHKDVELYDKVLPQQKFINPLTLEESTLKRRHVTKKRYTYYMLVDSKV